MNKNLTLLMLACCMLLSTRLLGQHVNLLEIRLSGGLVSEWDQNSFNSKGFTVEQERKKSGYFLSVGLGTHALLKIVETNYNLSYLSFDYTKVQHTIHEEAIASPIQSLSIVQNYAGATYFPFTGYNSTFSPFLYVGLGHNYIQITSEQGASITAATPTQGDNLPTVVNWVVPGTTSSIGGFGYEAGVGFKYLNTERLGAFLQARYNQVFQQQTDMVGEKLNMYQLEFGLIIRTLKQKRSI